MLEHHISKTGSGYPDDLTLLQKVYGRVCAERRPTSGSTQAVDLADMAKELLN